MECKALYMRERRQRQIADGTNAREMQKRAARRYGVSIEEIDRLTEEQNNRCAICGGPPTGNHGRLVMDHDHATNKFRGLICGNCNTGLGMFLDSPDLLRKAAEYIERRSGDGS